MAEIEWSSKAENDLNEIIDYIPEFNKMNHFEVFDNILQISPDKNSLKIKKILYIKG